MRMCRTSRSGGQVCQNFPFQIVEDFLKSSDFNTGTESQLETSNGRSANIQVLDLFISFFLFQQFWLSFQNSSDTTKVVFGYDFPHIHRVIIRGCVAKEKNLDTLT